MLPWTMVKQIWTEPVYITYTLLYTLHNGGLRQTLTEHVAKGEWPRSAWPSYWRAYGTVTSATAAGDDRSSVTLPMQH